MAQLCASGDRWPAGGQTFCHVGQWKRKPRGESSGGLGSWHFDGGGQDGTLTGVGRRHTDGGHLIYVML